MSSFSFTASGDRTKVVEQLKEQAGEDSCKAAVIGAVIAEVEAKREGATDFSVSGSVTIAYRQG